MPGKEKTIEIAVKMTGVIIIKQRTDYKVLEDLKGVGVLWGSVSRLSGFDSRAKHERTTD